MLQVALLFNTLEKYSNCQKIHLEVDGAGRFIKDKDYIKHESISNTISSNMAAQNHSWKDLQT